MLPPMADHPVLFLPGPTEVDAELRQVMAMPLLGHRDQRFVEVTRDVCTRLRATYLTKQHAAFETCPATALMEAAIRNLVPRGGRSLHLVCGAFSERWHQIAQLCGRDAEALVVPLGHAHDPEVLRRRLAQGPAVAAVCITHNETSTGVLEPLPALAAAVRETAPDAMLVSDVVTSLAGVELRFDDWGLDLAFAGTQKCLALPPGLCTYAISNRAIERARTVDDRGFLLDFVQAVPDTVAGKPLATPCVPLVFALQRQLQRVADEGLEARWRRHTAMRDTTLAWAATQGFSPFVVDAAARSPTVSCIDARGGDVAALAQRAKDGGFRIDQGYGSLKGKAFRIGHMGDHRPATLETLLRALARRDS